MLKAKSIDFVSYHQKVLNEINIIECPELFSYDVNLSDKCDPDLTKQFALGDIICRSIFGYRNEYKYIFDGNFLRDLYTEIDDYGSVPPVRSLAISYKNKLHPKSWKHSIERNSIVWFDKDVLNSLIIEKKKLTDVLDIDYDLYISDDSNGDEHGNGNDVADDKMIFVGHDAKGYWRFLVEQRETAYSHSSPEDVKAHILSGKCYFESDGDFICVVLCERQHFDW